MPRVGCNTAIIPIGRRCARQRKAHRLARLVEALPTIRRSVAQHLSGSEPTREFVFAAVIELVARTAIRPGSESYARLNGTRGATTLQKSNVSVEDDCVVLSFRAKGGKKVRKECDASRLVAALRVLMKLPGKRLFQYRDASGELRQDLHDSGERVPARDRGHANFAEGFPHAGGIGCA